LSTLALNAKATARPLKTKGVAFSSVRCKAWASPNAPFSSAPYATNGDTPDASKINAPIKSANAMAVNESKTERIRPPRQ